MLCVLLYRPYFQTINKKSMMMMIMMMMKLGSNKKSKYGFRAGLLILLDDICSN